MIRAMLLKLMSTRQVEQFAVEQILNLLDAVIKNPNSRGQYENILRLIRLKINKVLGDQI